MTTVSKQKSPGVETVDERVRRIVALHFDPRHGSPYWLARAAALGVEPLRQVCGVQYLGLLGEMTPEDLMRQPLLDYVPRAFHSQVDRFVLGQTGGTTGGGTWTAYREDEFSEAFVRPFAAAAAHVGFPKRAVWLYVGPSGPHIIGKVVRHLASVTDSADPFSVDFDPRWAKKLPEGSFAKQRYTAHVVEQAMAILNSQPIDVLFATPPLLERLAAAMSNAQRSAIRGVHYGGVAMSSAQLEHFQLEVFDNAVHLSGYGNTLFGCCLELAATAGRPLDYYPLGRRLLLETVGDDGHPVAAGEVGRVRFTRLDESMLIVRLRERDDATSVAVPDDAPSEFVLPGVRNPAPHRQACSPMAVGLY